MPQIVSNTIVLVVNFFWTLASMFAGLALLGVWPFLP